MYFHNLLLFVANLIQRYKLATNKSRITTKNSNKKQIATFESGYK